ncbi:MAG: DNA cytosine methyltransferase [Nanoarchaeota archaeon]
METIDLFAGVGGIRLGFERAGFNTVFANDFDPACKETYDLNSSEAKLFLGDITKIKVSSLPKFDILLAGFPCQPFSIAGYQKGFKDERGILFFTIANIIKQRRPKAFLLENVKNLRTHDDGKTLKKIVYVLYSLGYHVKYRVLNSMTHGNVPQNRERIFIVGFLDKQTSESFVFPEEIPLTRRLSDILEKNVDDRFYYNGKPLYDKLKNKVVNKDRVYQWRRRYVRENKSGVSPTLTANMGTGGHNVPIIKDEFGIRKLTPRECFSLQGFPASFKLPNLPDSKLYKQAGNSVTTAVIERVAKNMMKAIKSAEYEKRKNKK